MESPAAETTRRFAIDWGKLWLLVALVCIVAALFKPSWPLPRTVYHYSFIIDISQSMNARDYELNGEAIDRLNFSKNAVRQSIKHLPCGSTVGLGLFTNNNTYQLFNPLEVCEHYDIVDNVLNHINWRMAWANDSKIQYGLFAAIKILTRLEKPPRLVFLTDGDQSPKSDRYPLFSGELGKPGGLLVGVGQPSAIPVPHLDEQDNITGYWTRDEAFNTTNGNSLASRLYQSQLDEANLQRLGQITGMDYLHLENADTLSSALKNRKLGSRNVVDTDIRWLLAALALLSLLLYHFSRRTQ